jgi:2-dehydropantoate 2-reductase
VLVVGCGAVGGVLGAGLAIAGRAPAILTTNAAIARAVRANGLSVRGFGGERLGVAAEVYEELTVAVPPFDVVFLATQPPDVESAARSVLRWLDPRGQIVCLQNGLCEERLVHIAGRERLVGGVVSFGASMLGPGTYEQTARGRITLGRFWGAPDDGVARVAALLAGAFPVTITKNLPGVRWSKLCVNSIVSTLGTIAGAPLGQLLRHRRARRLALEIASETLAVARAEGIELEPVANTVRLERLELDARARTGKLSAALLFQHLLVLAVAARYRRMRSSMLSAIERGRTPAIDFLNGEIVARAKRHGIAVPVNARATELVWQIARRERSSGMDCLAALYESTRP